MKLPLFIVSLAALVAPVRGGMVQTAPTPAAAALVDRFKSEPVFWRQFEIGRTLAETADHTVVTNLEAGLTHDDRHLRGNVAYVLARLGDPRGFDTIAAILGDRGPRGMGQGISTRGVWTLAEQTRSDRYYAAHLLGDLRDPRGVALLVPLIDDPDVGYVVPWSLAEIGDGRAVGPLIDQLGRDDPSRRVLAILALEKLKARPALPRLRALLHDTRVSNFGDRISVADAARRAIDAISRAR